MKQNMVNVHVIGGVIIGEIVLYAATKAAEYENRIGADGQPVGIDPEVHIYLPSNGRDAALEAELGGPSLEERAELDRRRREEVERLDAQLRGWVRSGVMSEEAALLARSQWARPGDPAWIPQRKQLEYVPAPAEATEMTSVANPKNDHPEPDPPSEGDYLICGVSPMGQRWHR